MGAKMGGVCGPEIRSGLVGRGMAYALARDKRLNETTGKQNASIAV